MASIFTLTIATSHVITSAVRRTLRARNLFIHFKKRFLSKSPRSVLRTSDIRRGEFEMTKHLFFDRLVILNTLIILISFHFGACDIFTTRTPEKPNQGGSTFQPPTSADIVLLNLKNAISERSTENYVRCFVDSLSSSRRFEFIPASNSLARYPLLFSRWTLQSERSYFENLKAVMQQSAPSSLSLTGSFKVITSDSATYNADYQLTFQHGISGIPETVHGNLQFYLATDRNKIWSIYQWIDINIGQEAGWSELKGRFGN